MSYTNQQLARFILLLAIGINMLMHGLTRIFNLSGFAEKMTPGFEDTFLPTPLVEVSFYLIPIIEIAVGLLILSFRWAKWGLLGGGLLMALLLFGTTLKQDWGTAGSQMIYVLCFFLALWLLPEKAAK